MPLTQPRKSNLGTIALTQAATRAALARGNRYMAHCCGFTQAVLTHTLLAAGFTHVAAIRRGFAPYFDLRALATKGPMEDAALRALAAAHFPAMPPARAGSAQSSA